MKDSMLETKHYNTRIKFVRTYLGIDAKDVAKHLGIKPQQYSRYELGINCLPIKYLKPICEYLNISANYIIGITDEMEPIKKDTKK